MESPPRERPSASRLAPPPGGFFSFGAAPADQVRGQGVTRPGGVLVRPHHRGIGADGPAFPSASSQPAAARPGSSPRSHRVTSGDAGYRRSSSSRTPPADPATGSRPGPEEDPVDHRPVIGPPAALPRISRQERPQTFPLLITQIMTLQPLKHRTDLHDPATKIHGTRPKALESAGIKLGSVASDITGYPPRR